MVTTAHNELLDAARNVCFFLSSLAEWDFVYYDAIWRTDTIHVQNEIEISCLTLSIFFRCSLAFSIFPAILLVRTNEIDMFIRMHVHVTHSETIFFATPFLFWLVGFLVSYSVLKHAPPKLALPDDALLKLLPNELLLCPMPNPELPNPELNPLRLPEWPPDITPPDGRLYE